MSTFYQRECFTPDCFRLQDGKKMCMPCENYTNVKSLRIACMQTVYEVARYTRVLRGKYNVLNISVLCEMLLGMSLFDACKRLFRIMKEPFPHHMTYVIKMSFCVSGCYIKLYAYV